MLLRALFLTIEQPHGGYTNHSNAYDKLKHGSELLSPTNYPSSSRHSSLSSSIAAFFPGISTSTGTGTGEPTASTTSHSNTRSSRVSLPNSDADPSPKCVHSYRTPLLIHIHLIWPPFLIFHVVLPARLYTRPQSPSSTPPVAPTIPPYRTPRRPSQKTSRPYDCPLRTST